nr:hypothetical protein [uncultured Bacillus sp.]
MIYLKNEKGNAAIYMLWLLSIVAIIFVLIINIVKVYIVKEQANLVVEQAALAGTNVLLEKTEEAVRDFDTVPTLDPLFIADRELQRLTDSGRSIGDLIEDQKVHYMNNGMDSADAYIKAANKILPDRIMKHPFLKRELKNRLGQSSSDTYYIYSPTVLETIVDNNGKINQTNINLSVEEWRIEVKSSVVFESISDNKFINHYIQDIPQKGYGPTLSYLKNVYTN